MLFFEDGSPNKDIHEALRNAVRLRKALRKQEDEQAADRAAAAQQAGDAEEGNVSGRRGVDRRTLAGRASR
jgi:hypothetical protein